MIGCTAPAALMNHNRSRIRILLVHVVRPLRYHLILIDVDQIALIMGSTVMLLHIITIVVTLTLVIVDVLYLYVLICVTLQVHQMLAVRRRCHIQELIVTVSLGVPSVVLLLVFLHQAALLLLRCSSILAIMMKQVQLLVVVVRGHQVPMRTVVLLGVVVRTTDSATASPGPCRVGRR